MKGKMVDLVICKSSLGGKTVSTCCEKEVELNTDEIRYLRKRRLKCQ